MIKPGHVRQLLDLRSVQQEQEAMWFRQLLTLAAGGLALLVGLAPPAEGFARFFLAGTWVCLGAGICAGAAATYLEAHRARALADAFRSELRSALREERDPEATFAEPHPFFSWARIAAVGALLLGVCCLVVFAVITTLDLGR